VLIQETYLGGPTRSGCSARIRCSLRLSRWLHTAGRSIVRARPRTDELGTCRWSQAVADMMERVAKEVRYQGIIDVGFRFDERDGRFKLLDVNP
jgi:hypothetical protein